MKKIAELLIQYFPDQSTISYKDFIHSDRGMDLLSHIYDYNENIQRHTFNLISLQWTKICWPEIVRFESNNWMLPGFLNKKSFIHAFPSLLNFLSIVPSMSQISNQCDLLVDCFINELDMAYVHNTWKHEYYLSLNEDVKKIISFLLRENEELYDANKTIKSYWGDFNLEPQHLDAE